MTYLAVFGGFLFANVLWVILLLRYGKFRIIKSLSTFFQLGKDPSSWDDRWMDLASFVARWSKDRSRKLGAVIVDSRNVLVSIGWNGFPRKINDNVEIRHTRPLKYLWTEHDARNAIYNASAKGVSTLGCKMYVSWFPCTDCARGIIQSGVSEVIAIEPDWSEPKWGEDYIIAREMLEEAGVSIAFMSGRSPPVSVG